ncbi:MAG: beta-propeller domain-containing protein [Verrucomicrobia bacterium]|nr:beta-propeller domain-containing protein [Verrucomicrobiota bacterium]
MKQIWLWVQWSWGRAVSLALAVFLFTFSNSTVAETIVDQPTITSIRLLATEVFVVVRVPVGTAKVVLESRPRLGRGPWQPRAVARLPAGEGEATFRLPRSAELEILRARADTTDTLPSSFFQGTNSFAGQQSANAGAGAGSWGVVFSNASSDGLLTVTDAAVAPRVFTAETAPRAVVESDIWKLRGDTLYFFNQYRGLQIIDVAAPDHPVVQGTLELPAVGEQMYLLEDNYVVLLTREGCGGLWAVNGVNTESQVLIVKVENGGPRVVAQLPVRGQTQESRLVGTALYVASQGYRSRSDNPNDWEIGNFVCSFDLANPEAPVEKSSLWYPGYRNTITATDRFLFVAVPLDYQVTHGQTTPSLVHCLDIAAPDGTMRELSSFQVLGQVKDKFKMHVNGDVVTVISEEWAMRSVGPDAWLWRPATKLETFSLADPAAPRQLGGLELAAGEQLHATRFDGDKVYVVTFMRVDPLWIVDLSDPAQPQVKGELEVPGWSTYIQPLGDRLVTIGIDNTDRWRVAVSLFDVRDVAKPALLSKVSLGENNSWSEANHDEKAFGFLPEAGLLLVPFSSWSAEQREGVQLIDLGADTLTKRGVIAHDVSPRRATIHRDRILSLSGRELLSVDATDRDQPVVRGGVELSWNVDRVVVHGDYLLEFGSGRPTGGSAGPLVFADAVSGAVNDPARPVLRVVPAADPGIVLRGLVLTNQPLLGLTAKDNRLYVAQGQSAQVVWPLFPPPPTGVGDPPPPPVTNAASLLLTIFDLDRLPELVVLGQKEISFDDQYWNNLEAVWPSPGVLVWASATRGSTGYYWGGPGRIRFWPVRPVNGFDLTLTVVDFVDVEAIWLHGWYGERASLVAFDVGDVTAPKFLSRVNVAGTNNWWNFSRAHTANGLLYLSHESSEDRITGTNFVQVVSRTYTTVTNVIVETNYTHVTRRLTNVQTGVLTNEVRLATRNRLGASAGPGHATTGIPATAISARGNFTLALAEDGAVWAWGENGFSQLGDDTFESRAAVLPVAGLDRVTALASGAYYSLALNADGALWAWGAASHGQLGLGGPAEVWDGPLLPRAHVGRPSLVPSLDAAVDVAAGHFHTLALTTAGGVWSWGANYSGQLGDGRRETRHLPGRVANLEGVADVECGIFHSLAVKRDGTLWAWGGNELGQLGDATSEDRPEPQPVPGLSGVLSAAGGMFHTLAVGADGTVWTWGGNESGQLGAEASTPRFAPAPVAGLSGAIAVAAGAWHSLALKADGTVWAWGRNDSGQLGDGTTADRSAPQPVLLLSRAIAIAAGRHHGVALTDDGSVWCWGASAAGQLGDGEPVILTKEVPFSNVVVTSTSERLTNYVYWTNVVQVPHETVTTNEVPIHTYVQRSFLDVVDYAAPDEPLVRTPVNIPGALRGLGHNGDLLYTVGSHWTDGPQDWTEWLDVSAYDGVAAYLVDSLALPREWPRPLLLHRGAVLIGRSARDTNEVNAVEAWALSAAGKLVRARSTNLPSAANVIAAFGDLVVVQTPNRLELFDATDPLDLKSVGSGGLSSCLGFSLDAADGALERGLWLPLGDYGVRRVGGGPPAGPD